VLNFARKLFSVRGPYILSRTKIQYCELTRNILAQISAKVNWLNYSHADRRSKFADTSARLPNSLPKAVPSFRMALRASSAGGLT
jgi:hypothetical protein